VNVVCRGQTSWYGFAVAIISGLAKRGISFPVKKVVPIGTQDYPTKAKRPSNSRLDLTRLRDVYGIEPPSWNDALEVELDLFCSTTCRSAPTLLPNKATMQTGSGI
jgi:dTDP-4-dehydrorhamnose reductase